MSRSNSVLGHLLVHRGRTSRSQFWWSFLGAVVTCLAVGSASRSGDLVPLSFVLWACVLSLAVLLVRRYRDAGVPVFLALLIFMPWAWSAYVDATVPYPDNDDGPAMLVGGLFNLACWGTMLVLASLPSRPPGDGLEAPSREILEPSI